MYLEKGTEVGTYKLCFKPSTEKSLRILQFSQSSSGKLEQIVHLQNHLHILKENNPEEVENLINNYQVEFDEVVSKFHNEINLLMVKISSDFGKLK